MAGIKDNLVTLTSKPLTSFTSTELDSLVAGSAASNLRCGPATPPCDIEASVLSRNQDAARAFDTNRTQHDSGYVSLVSTPSTNKSWPFLSDPRLEIFNKPVPDDLRDRFLDIRVLYTQPLWKAVSGKRKWNPGDISMKLKYMGENELDAQLYIVVQCEKRVSKKVKRFFVQKHVLEDLRPYFRVYIIDTGLLQLSTGDIVRVHGDLRGPRDTSCGMAIEMSVDDSSRLATLGGLIMVFTTKKTLYGLTASHPLASLRQDPLDRPPSLEDGGESDSDDEDFEVDSEADSEVNFGEGSESVQLSGPDQECFDQGNHLSRDSKSDIGTIIGDSLHSMQNTRNHDWALIRLDREYWAPNCLGLLPESLSPASEQKIEVTDDEGQRRNGSGLGLFCSKLLPSLSEQPVVIITCRGLQQGTLASNHSCLMMSPGRTFVETLDFSPYPESRLKSGDSGSWVVNEATGEVYGHVVSVDALGEAYVMPIQSTLLDIQTHLGAHEVCLPTMEEVFYLRGSQEDAVSASAIPAAESRDTMLTSLIKTFQMKAQKEFKEGNFRRAETSQIEAITHLEEREASYGVPFDNRVHMQQFLAEIYIKQHSLEQALSIMLKLMNSGSDPVNEEGQAVLLVEAKQHQLLAEIYHERYLSNSNTDDLQRAEILARSAFNKITSSAPNDPQSRVSCQLLVLIYQAQRRTGLTEFYQSLTTSGSLPSPTSPVVPPRIESPQPSQAEIIININAKDSNGRTPLISAIRSCDESRLQAVLDLNPNIHLRCTKDQTPLMHAIEVKFEIAVRRLVDRGAEVNATILGQSTALHQAASRGSTDMIELLISLGAAIEYRDGDGATPLLKASEANQSTTVSILLRKGADVSVKDNNGWGVLHYTVHSSAVDVLRVLFQNEGVRIDPNSRCPAGKTALHFAAENASLEPAEILLDHGADIEARDFSMRKRTPLHLAVSKAPTEQRIAFVRLLLYYHAYVDISQFSPQERRQYGHLLHGPSLAKSDSGFSSLSPEVPEEDRHHVEALLDKYSLQTIEHLFLEATKSRRNSVASFSTTSGSSLFTHRLSIGSSFYSSSSSDFNPSISSSASSRSRTVQRAVHYPLGLDPDCPVLPSARRAPYEFTVSVKQAFSENSPLSQVDNDYHEASQSPIYSNERVLFCTFCAEQNVNKTFGTKSDWKKHETRIHETGQEWPCPTPNCCLVFDRDADFSRHHQRSHPGRPLPPLSDVKVQLLPKGVFGCGFDNCKALLSSWNDRCDHVAKHMKDGMKRTQWRYTNVIRNLIRQDSIRDDWKFLFVTFREQLKKDESQLCWHPHDTRILRQKLECSDFRPNHDDFLITTLKLGLDLPPPSVPGSSKQAVALPDGFVTPSFDSVENIDTLSPEQFRVILRGGPSNQYSRFRLDIPKSPLEQPPEQLLQSPLLSQGITEDQEPSYDHTIGFNSSQDRISFMDVVDTVPELSLSMESMDQMSSCLDSPIPRNSTYYPSFVDPGRPTNPLIRPFPNYFDSTPTIQDSPLSARPSPGRIIKKSLKRAKRSFTLRRSQQLDPATGTNHPDLPAEYEVPCSTAGPS